MFLLEVLLSPDLLRLGHHSSREEEAGIEELFKKHVSFI